MLEIGRNGRIGSRFGFFIHCRCQSVGAKFRYEKKKLLQIESPIFSLFTNNPSYLY